MYVSLIIFLSHLLNACLHTVFYYKTIGLSHRWKGLRLICIIVIYSILSTAATTADNSSPWGISIYFVIVILYPVLFLGGRLRERLFWGIICCAMAQFANILSIYVSSDNMWDLFGEKLNTILLVVVLIKMIYVVLAMFIVHLNTSGKHYIPHKYWIGTIICPFAIVICMTIVFNFDIWFADDPKLYSYTIVFTLVFLVVWILLYFVYYLGCKYFFKVNEANMLAVQNDMIERYILQKQASGELIKILSHDLKHSLVEWRALAEEKDDEAVLKSISEYERQLFSTQMINVENDSANAIINQKLLEARQANVKFQIDGVFYKDLILSKLDVCSLLGNLLDNAIEAAVKAETEDLRCVRLSIKRKDNLLILAVKNGYAAQPVLENGTFTTNKKDKERHGIGMISINYVVDKYNGAVHSTFEDNWFKTTIMLSGYQTLETSLGID